MLILFQIGKSLDNMIQFIVFSAIDLALEYIDVINSIRNSSPPSSLKYLRPIGTRVETGGVRILFGGKSKTIRSSSAQIHTSVDNTLAHTVLGWALWCWEALYGNVVVAWLKYCYTHTSPPAGGRAAGRRRVFVRDFCGIPTPHPLIPSLPILGTPTRETLGNPTVKFRGRAAWSGPILGPGFVRRPS